VNLARLLRIGSRIALPAAVAASTLAACIVTDPVHQREVDALGPEVAGVPKGELHRAGQPCAVCHGPKGPASTQFAVAGTVFAQPGDKVGVPDVQVLLVDSDGTNPPSILRTNCVGNFYVLADPSQGGWDPQFPIEVGIARPERGEGAQMIGHLGREASCAFCHADPAGLSSPGHVYLNTTPDPNASCPVSPTVSP
jgi:hypothetical protein